MLASKFPTAQAQYSDAGKSHEAASTTLSYYCSTAAPIFAPAEDAAHRQRHIDDTVGTVVSTACGVGQAGVSYYTNVRSSSAPPRHRKDVRREETMRKSCGGSTAPCRAHNRAIMEADTVTAILAFFERCGGGFDGCNLSTALSRVAKLTLDHSQGRNADLTKKLDSLRCAILSRLHEFAPRHVCNVIWSLGKLGIRDTSLLEALATHITRNFRQLSPRDVGVASWGFACVRYRHTPSLSALGAMAIEHCEILEPPELANVVWGFATLQFRQGQVMAKLAPVCTSNTDLYQPKELASVLWSYSSMSYRDDHETRTGSPLFTKIGGVLAARAGDFDPQGVTNLVWSYANIPHWAPQPLMHGCAKRLGELWPELKPQEIANSVWAYERLRSEALADTSTAWLASLANGNSLQAKLSDWTGEQLLKLADYLEVYRPEAVASTLAVKEFEKRFYSPIREFLMGLSDDLSYTNYAKILKSFGLYHLGPHFTPRFLDAIGSSLGHHGNDAAFREQARASLRQYYLESEAAPAPKEPAMITGGQTTSRWIAAEMRYHLTYAGAAAAPSCQQRKGSCVVPAGEVKRPGTLVVDFGSCRDDDLGNLKGQAQAREADAADGGCERVEDVEKSNGSTPYWLWDVTLAGDVGRGSHCECVALSECIGDELRALGFTAEEMIKPVEGLRENARKHLVGEILLFTTHYPCLSCLGLIAQFRWRFPGVQLRVGYVEWRDWQRELQESLQQRGAKLG